MTKDLLAGFLFLTIGLVGLVVASGYAIGSATRMGPGYVPMLVSGIIAVIGAAMAIREWRARASSTSAIDWDGRQFAFVIAAILAFAFLIDSYGLIAGVAAVVILSSIARPGVRAAEVTILAAALVVIAIAIFIFGLGLPLKLAG